MTIIAGVIRIADAAQSPTRLLNSMLENLEADSQCALTRHEGAGFALAHIDTGALSVDGHLKDEHSRFTAIAGWPIARAEGASPENRAGDLAFLHHAIVEGRAAQGLDACCGQFALIHADEKSDRFIIASDKGGFRPLYCARYGGHFLFSSMLKLLETVPELINKVDIHGLVEQAVLGYPLANRTPYAAVELLDPGSFLEIQSGNVACVPYFSRSNLKPFQGSREDALDELYDRFMLAVKDRAAPHGTQRSFLSGGLDARSVVMALRSQGLSVNTVTFDKDGLPDGRVAAEFSQKVGTQHATVKSNHSCLQRDLKASVFKLCPRLDDGSPRTIFTGDGGSVGLGLDYVSRPLLECFARNDMTSAVEIYLKNKKLARRAFLPDVYEKIRGLAREGVIKELARDQTLEPLQRFYLFLLRNDQRRHLHYFYEQIAIHRIEFLTPFYDPRVMDFVASCPLEWFLFHEFYHEWLKRFPDAMTSVAWQTYPGHVPCPIPLDAGNQWKLPYRKRVAQGVPLAREVLSYFRRGQFPRGILRRGPAAVAALLLLLRMSNERAILRTAQVFCRYAGSVGNAREMICDLKMSDEYAAL